jgi:hypothetical protein
MANTVNKDVHGPIWVLGNIANATPGTPLNIMSLVDPTLKNDPNNPTAAGLAEYTVRCYAIIFQACKAGAAHGTAINTGNIYIIRRNYGTGAAGTGNRDDLGVIIQTLTIGATSTGFLTWTLTAAALNRDVLNPYDFVIDADTAADGCQVTLLIQ